MGKSPNHLRKMGRKKIRETTRNEYIPDDITPKPKKILHGMPSNDLSHQKKAMFEKQKSQLTSFQKDMKQKKAKNNSKSRRSKFSNPREVDYRTEPESVHPENQKWMQNLRSQTLDKAKKLRKKLQGYMGRK